MRRAFFALGREFVGIELTAERFLMCVILFAIFDFPFVRFRLGFIDEASNNAMRSNVPKISWHFKTVLRYRIIKFRRPNIRLFKYFYAVIYG